jgi:hypothetical protein
MDIFERIRQIIGPSDIKQPTSPSSSRGLEAVNQIRSSLNLTPKQATPAPQPLNLSRFTPTLPKPTSFDTSRFEARIPTPTPQPQMSRLPQVRPQQIMSVRPQEPKAIPFQTFTPRVPEAETALGKFFVSKAVLPLNVGLKKLESAWKNTDNKGGLERTLEGIEGAGIIATIPNEAFIQPIWDSLKLGVKGLREGKITQNDVDKFIFSSGGQKGTIFEAFGTNEEEFGNQFGNVALAAARFADFAPELINIPGTQSGKAATLAREVKLTGKGAKEIGEQASKAKRVEDAIKNFEIQTGEKLNNVAKQEIRNIVNNPVPFFQSIRQNLTNLQKSIPETATRLTTNVEDVIKSVKKGVPTNTSEGANLGAKIISGAQKERRFAKTTVAGAERTAKETRKILDEATDLYNPLNNKAEFRKAENFVNSNSVDDVLNRIRTTPDSREVTYLGQALMNKFQKVGDFASEAQLAIEISQKATELGQAIQALSIWKKLSPTGAKLWAQKLADRANSASKAVAGDKNFIKFTDKELADIGKQAEQIGKAVTEYDKAVQTQLLAKIIAAKLPKDVLSQLGTLQTMAQLINPKTLIRNIVGNLIFGLFEAVSNGVATPLDMAVGLFTKKRGVANISPKEYFKGAAEGFSKGVNESLLGIDTMGTTTLEQGVRNGSVFSNKIMQGLEKTLNLVLRPFDRAFYEANYKSTLAGLMKASGVTKPTQEMIEQAHYMGLYRTFQDDNVATKIFSGLKRTLNVDKPFGIGDFILKYTKVPANMIVRAADYSPIGYVKAVMTLAQPLFKKGPFDQAEFVNAISRASVGTFGVMNTGYALGKLGIITPKPESNKDVRNAQQLDGVRSYAINVSALKRYVASGFDAETAKQQEGDELFSYDWAQPVSIPLAMGANWAETEKLKKNSAQERILQSFGAGGVAFADAMTTLTDQPLLQGLKTTFSPQGLVQGLINAAKGAPASFVPTILNQINQLTDNTRRETFNPDLLEESKNIAINKIPFLSQSLPPKYDIFGKPAEKYQGGTNTFVNVMLNPAFVSKIGSDENLKEVIRLYETVGDTGVIPNTVDKKIKINKEDVILTGEQMSNYQKEIGTKSDEYIRKLLSSEDYYKLPDDTKASLIAKGLSNINSAAKINLFGDRPENISLDVSLLQNNQMDNYVYKLVTDAVLDQPKRELSVLSDQLEVLFKGQRNPQEISKFIIDNKIPQSSITGIINKIKKDEIFNQIPSELQKYNGLTNSQLEELKTLKPQLSSEIIQYQNLSKAFDNVSNARIGFYRNLGTKKPKVSAGRRKTGRIAGGRIRKPRKPSLKLARIKGIKTPRTKQIKLAKIKRPKPLKLS